MRGGIAGIARVLLEFKDSYHTNEQHSSKHEQKPHLDAIQKTFTGDVLSLLSTNENMGNPFMEDSGDLLTLDIKLKEIHTLVTLCQRTIILQ